MVLVNSTMLPLGTACPDFSLPDPRSGETVGRPAAGAHPATLVAFLSNHCPYVQHVLDGFQSLADEMVGRGVRVIAIGSNDVGTYPQDGPKAMAELATARGFAFPYVHDADQSVARAFRAACTPDFYVFDGRGALAYRGRLDGATPGNDVPVSGEELRAALEAVLGGTPAPSEQRASIGCNLKWTPGCEPEWFARG